MEQDVAKVDVCPTRLLDDQPTDNDAFRHRVIAKAISRMINEERGGRAIALTGDWGSGKSTVVQLLGNELRDRRVKIITFDAWAHQGDPLRRSFLELAIEELQDFLHDKEKWEREREKLAKRLVETDTKTSPQLTGIGALGAFALLLSPVSLQVFALLSANYKNEATPWFIYIFFTLGSAPLLIAITMLVCWALDRKKDRNGKKIPLPSLIYSSSENRVVGESYKTADPTTVEFEKAYCELLHDALSGNDQKVVIVVDNLDRLEPDDATSVWSTLRTFFDKQLRAADWFDRTWILVPFDEAALARTRSDDKDTVVNPFVEKTFQAFLGFLRLS